MTRQDATTRIKLLDAAEILFAETGFASTSVRAITEAAEANVASVHYHFGSKLELIKAVLARRVGPLNAERIRRLGELEARGGFSLEEVVRAFVEPALEWVRSEEDRSTLAKLIGLAFSQPTPEVRQVMLEEFAPVVERFVPVLEALLPGVGRSHIYWRLHFMVGSLVFSIGLGGMVGALSRGLCDPGDVSALTDELVGFLAAGFRHGTQDAV